MADFDTYATFDFSLSGIISHPAIVDRSETGVEQRRLIHGTRVPREWSLPYRNQTQAEFEGVRNFFNTKQGVLNNFTFESTDETTT